jgi:hypothetical protein
MKGIVSIAYCRVMTEILFKSNKFMMGHNGLVALLAVSAFEGNNVLRVA